MLTSECWLGWHDHCCAPEHCDCLCHVESEELLQDVGA